MTEDNEGLQMSDPQPLPSWVPPELEPEYREWQAWLDGYITHWSGEVRKFLEEKGHTRQNGGKPQLRS